MIYLEEAGYDAPEYDICGSSPVYAVLKANGISIPLCSSCLEELRQELAEYDSRIHCYQCDHFVVSSSGLSYGGSCKLAAKEEGVEITEDNAGYVFGKDFNSYNCPNAKRKTE